MPYYFVGGEDHDFTKIGAVSVNTAITAARRTANARCALQVGPSGAATDGWPCSFDVARSSFWFTAQVYFGTGGTTGSGITDFLSFTDSTATRRIGIDFASASLTYRLYKKNAAGTKTVLATSSVTTTLGVRQKLDVQVSYATAGSINVYLDETLILAYSGDVTTDGATSLNGAVLGASPYSGTATARIVYWSEVICASEDTRSLSLVTMPPTANGNVFAWSNSYANVNEVTLDDATLCTSSNADDLAQATVSSGGITGNPAIRAVCISARAQKGGTGPQNLQMNVRTGGNDYFSSTQALPAALGRVAAVFETNPATSGPFAYTDLTAAGFNVGVKSVA